MTEHIYTSDEILNAEDLYEIQENVCSFGIPVQYQLTEGEQGWVDFVRTRYSIADYIDAHTNDAGILTINDACELSYALDNDCAGFGKAVCLSDDTALQHLFFWLYTKG